MEPYLGEIMIWGGTFTPVGWHDCDGSLLSIADYPTLYNLLGTTYGGDGQTTFGIPDLRGRVPVHQGAGAVLGQQFGVETVTLTAQNLPPHTHTAVGTTAAASSASPSAGTWATRADSPYSTDGAATVALSAAALDPTGGGQPHPNLPPYLGIRYAIATEGIYPAMG